MARVYVCGSIGIYRFEQNQSSAQMPLVIQKTKQMIDLGLEPVQYC